MGGHLEDVYDGGTVQAALSQRDIFWVSVNWKMIYGHIRNIIPENCYLYLSCKNLHHPGLLPLCYQHAGTYPLLLLFHVGLATCLLTKHCYEVFHLSL